MASNGIYSRTALPEIADAECDAAPLTANEWAELAKGSLQQGEASTVRRDVVGATAAAGVAAA
ncbi:hypothetical protein DFJ73DRAFT_783158 [Zopfochytrium polystomum]|nr:hypothetical protein DFJ73DRAFT_783158 [Zopfochytrium polystomum]